MKTEQLKDLGLEKEQIAEVMKLNGLAIEKIKQELEKSKKELETTKGTLESYEQSIAELEKKAAGKEELTKAVEEYKSQIETIQEEKSAEVTKIRKTAEIKTNILENYSVHNVDDVMNKIDLDKVEVTDAGLHGLKEQMESVKENYPYQFKEERPAGTGGSLGNAPKGTIKPDISKEEFNQMGYKERIELKHTKPEIYESLSKEI